MIKKLNKTEMGIQITTVATSIVTAMSKLCSTMVGKFLIISAFLCSTFAGISGIINITILLCLIDLFFGVTVTIIKKGWEHILSSRLRDSLIKVFFYILLICLLFLIETQLVDGYYFTSKAAFAMISGVELLSITASMLILFPNFPVLKLLKKILTKEMSKKLDLTEEEVKNDTETNI